MITFCEMLQKLDSGEWKKARAESWRYNISFLTLEVVNYRKQLMLNTGASKLYWTVPSSYLFGQQFERVCND